MTRIGSDSLIRMGRTVPGWETKLRRFNNSCAEWTALTNSYYAGTIATLTDTSDADLDCTISIWFKISTGYAAKVGLFSFNDATIPFALFGAYYDNLTGMVRLSWGPSASIRHQHDHAFVPDGEWHNIICSSKRLTGEVTSWLDGTDKQNTGVVATQGGLTQPIRFGDYADVAFGIPVAYGCVAFLDEIASFDSAISSDSDAANLYNNGLPPDLNDDATYTGGAALNKSTLALWLRWERDPSNGRNFTSQDTWNASEQTIGSTAPLDRKLTWADSTKLLPFVSHDTTHILQPDYAALADAWGDWSKGLTFPATGTRYALGSGVEVRIAAPGLMPTFKSGWGYHQGGTAWITLNTTEPYSTPITTADTTTLQPDSYPVFNADLQTALDARNLRVMRGLFARKV